MNMTESKWHSGDFASLVVHLVKNPPAMQEIQVRFLSQEDLLEKGYGTHSRVLGLSWWLRIHLQCGRSAKRIHLQCGRSAKRIYLQCGRSAKRIHLQCRRSGCDPLDRDPWIAYPGIGYPLQYSWASLVAQLVKNPPAVWKTWVWSLGWEDPLEKGKATHSSIVAWRIAWTEEPGRLQSMGIVIFLLDYSLKGSDHICLSHSLHCNKSLI